MSNFMSFLDKDLLVDEVPAKVPVHKLNQQKKKAKSNADEQSDEEIEEKPKKANKKSKQKKIKVKKESKTTNEMFDFMEGWTINTEKIPGYPEFENDTFYEKVDKTILMLLLKDKSIVDEQKVLLNKLINKIKNGNIQVNHTQLMKNNDLGRFYPEDNTSIISLCRKIKHTMFKYLGYTDFDMVSCHQSIALSIAEINSVELPGMFEYMFNKAKIIEEEIKFYSMGENKLTVEDVKYKFNMMSYGGSEVTWREHIKNGYDGFPPRNIKDKESDFTKKFKNDIKVVQHFIYENNKELFKKIYVKYDNLTKDEEIDKNKRTLLSCFFQVIENHILFIAFKCLQSMKVITKTNVCLEYDGLCVPSNNFDKEKVINDLNKRITELTGLKFIKFKIKDYDCVIGDVIEKRKSIDVETNYVLNDLDAAKKIYKLYPHWNYCNGELYVFDFENGLWSNNEMVYFRIISYYEDYLYTINNNGTVSSTKSYGNTAVLTKKLINMIKTLCIDDNWLKNNEDTSLGKLLFNNGYCDMKEGKFYEKKEDRFDNYKILFFFKIDFDYLHPNEKDKKYINEIRETLFYKPLNKNVGNYLLSILSRIIAGDRMKKIFFGLGTTNAGKSVLAKAFSLAFCGYVGIFNAECLSNRHTSNDEAQQNRWAFLLRYVRLLFSNEIKTSIELNGATIKKHSSGGDGLIGRVHGGLETTFIPHYKLVVFANDVPQIVPYDDALETRIEIFNYVKSFVNDPKTEFELKLDPNLENEIKTLKFRRGLVNLIIEQYTDFIRNNNKINIPKEMEENKAEWIGDSTRNIIDGFIENYKITNKVEDYILSSDITHWVNSSKFGITSKKFFIELKKYIYVKKYDNVKPDKRKINGNAENIWLGIKEK